MRALPRWPVHTATKDGAHQKPAKVWLSNQGSLSPHEISSVPLLLHVAHFNAESACLEVFQPLTFME